ncbi:hypothetical protein ABW21_db0209670 [Orbilia brochopaga]|nr:hypothetical protein ABW21_db0209670 [Drechslerella brochopaga]
MNIWDSVSKFSLPSASSSLSWNILRKPNIPYIGRENSLNIFFGCSVPSNTSAGGVSANQQLERQRVCSQFRPLSPGNPNATFAPAKKINLRPTKRTEDRQNEK